MTTFQLPKLFAPLVAVLGLTLASADMAVAEPVGGPRESNDVLQAGESKTYRVLLEGGETTSIFLRGDGRSPLYLFIDDASGNPVRYDSAGTGDLRGIHVRPRDTVYIYVTVKNAGTRPNRFVLVGK